VLPPPNPEIEHVRAQFRGSECSRAATTPFFAKSSSTAFVLSRPTTSCPPLLPNQDPLPSFCHGQLPPAPVFAKSSIQVLGLAKTNSAALVLYGRPPPVPVFAKSNTWMLDLAKTSPTAFVLSRPIATCPRFCQIGHLNARVGKNEPPLPSVCHGRPPPAPFLPNRAPGRSVWQKQAHHLRFVTANHLPSLLPNRALDVRFGKNEPYRLRFVNAHHHLPPFLPNRALGCSVWQKRPPPLTPLFPNPDTKDATKLVASFCLWVLLYCSFIPLVVNPVFSDLMHDSPNLT